MYRARLKGRQDPIISEYVSSIDDDAAIAHYDILGSMAHVIMLNKTKLVSKKDASKILGALLAIKPKSLTSSADSEDIHELVESIVVNRAKDAGMRMHTARSRNDQVALDIRMKLRDDVTRISGLAADLAKELLDVASRHTKTIMPLYTHLQQAQYGTLSHYFIAHADSLLRDIERLDSAYAHINASPLGASAVGGTSLKIDRRFTARLLGFDGIVENSIDATSARDHVAEFVAALAIMMTSLSKIAEDLVIWSSTEFSFVELGDKVSSPSSVMPHKKNPDVLELTRSKAAEAIGQLVVVLGTSKGLATGYGRDLQNAKIPTWRVTKTTAGALAAMRMVIKGIKIDKKRMEQSATSGYLDALEITEMLVSDSGIAFREAHSIVARLTRAAHESGVDLASLDESKLSAAVKGTRASKKDLIHALGNAGPQKALQRRRSTGSAGFAEQEKMIRSRKAKLAKVNLQISRKERNIKNTYDKLEQMAKRIAKS